MRIACVHSPTFANALYRAAIPMAALEGCGHEVTLLSQTDGESVSLDTLAQHDLVHVHRLIVNDDPGYVARLHDAGVRVCFDNDDHFGSITAEMWDRMPEKIQENIDKLLEEDARSLALLPQMDLVTTPSETLAERFRAAGAKDVRVIENFLPRNFLRIVPVERPGFTIGWHAGQLHYWDAVELGIERVLEEVLEAHPHVHVVTLGLDLRIDHSRYTHCKASDFRDLTNQIAGFDIGIAPLADNPFSLSRSPVKVREYAAAGVPWLASAVGPYVGLGKAEGGRLVEDGDWFAALDDLIRSPVDRVMLRRRAKAWTRRETIDQTVEVWEDAFLDALEGDRPSRAVA